MEVTHNKPVLNMLQQNKGKSKGFALLIDPDKADADYLERCVLLAVKSSARLIFIGGSLVFNHLEPVFKAVRERTDIPLVLFPGSAIQVNHAADAILFLSLISGRNPDFLIGNHVIAAPFLRKHKVEVLPTGYLLVDGGRATTVEYISQTRPIPADKPDIAVATAMAGEMLGHQLIYMDSGSGAMHPVPSSMIEAVSAQISVPLIVGGGIRSGQQALQAYQAGADLIVVGNKVEENPGFLTEIHQATVEANSSVKS